MATSSSRKARWAALRGDYATAGDLYRLAGDVDRALQMYRKGRLFRAAGEVAAEQGNFAVASREFEHGGLNLEAAESALEAGDRDRAARLFVLAGQPRRAAEIQERSGKMVAAAALYEHAGDLVQAARLYLGAREPLRASRVLSSLLKTGAPEAIAEEVRQVAAECGDQLLTRGYAEQAAAWYERSGQTHLAARAWERAGKRETAVRIFLQCREYRRAAELAEKAAPGEIDPGLAAEAFQAVSEWAAAAALHLEAGNPKQAASCLEKLGLVTEAAWAHEQAGDPLGAAAAFESAGDAEQAAALYTRAGALADAARCLEQCGRLHDAADAYAKCHAWLPAASLLVRIGDLDRAVKALQNVDDDSDQAAAASLLLAGLFERKGLDSLAAEHYRRALAADAGLVSNLETWYRFGSVSARLGRLQEAIQAYKRVVSSDFQYKDAADKLAALEARVAESSTNESAALPARYVVESEFPCRLLGAAFVGFDSVMDRKVMLRRFGTDCVPNDAAAERLLRDIRRISRLHHPSIAAIHDAGRDEQGVYLIQELVSGRSLREILETTGAIEVPRTIQVLTQLAEALDYAHGLGLLARNIRPETIYVSPTWEARLIDFGLSMRHTDSAGLTPAYRPPETARGERMDPASDIYQLGVLAWELHHGFPPPTPAPNNTEPPTFDAISHQPIPDVLKRVVVDSLHPDRSRRLGSAQELLEQLHGTNMLPGALLANRYEIKREIGRGGMGSVYEARDLVLDEPVALKVLKGPLDDTTEKRFVQEIRLARQISHPNIVRVHTLDRWRDVRFIVMEFIEGVDLRAWVEGRHPIPVTEAIELIVGIGSGLDAAHRLGIVHRDVKPENVLIDRAGRPRLVDFGIARQGDLHLTREGLVIGSPAYMAPEQIRGKSADHRADLYSLGILAYMLLTGHEPFASESVADVLRMQLERIPKPPSTLRGEITTDLDALLMRVLAKDPARRPDSVRSFIEQVEMLATVTAV